jgi:hypothetical protein
VVETAHLQRLEMLWYSSNSPLIVLLVMMVVVVVLWQLRRTPAVVVRVVVSWRGVREFGQLHCHSP